MVGSLYMYTCNTVKGLFSNKNALMVHHRIRARHRVIRQLHDRPHLHAQSYEASLGTRPASGAVVAAAEAHASRAPTWKPQERATSGL